jgi:hypothetical protein
MHCYAWLAVGQLRRYLVLLGALLLPACTLHSGQHVPLQPWPCLACCAKCLCSCQSEPTVVRDARVHFSVALQVGGIIAIIAQLTICLHVCLPACYHRRWIDLSNNQLAGALELPPVGADSERLLVLLNLSGNKLTGRLLPSLVQATGLL